MRNLIYWYTSVAISCLKKYVQSTPVVTKSQGPDKLVCYNQDFFYQRSGKKDKYLNSGLWEFKNSPFITAFCYTDLLKITSQLYFVDAMH